MVDMAHIAGLVAAKLHPDPVPHADFVTSTSHKTLRGPRAGFILTRPEWGDKINSAVFPGIQGGPLMHVVAAKAVAFREAAQPAFKDYIAQVLANAKVLADELARAGFPIVSGGTDNHLMLVDVTAKGTTGKQAEHALDAAGITVNKNMIPFDERKPMDPSGIRVGTPALTTRGMGVEQMRLIGRWMLEALRAPEDAATHQRIRQQAAELGSEFPVPAAALEAVSA
jgi:glycine hydroxymethyltransferase